MGLAKVRPVAKYRDARSAGGLHALRGKLSSLSLYVNHLPFFLLYLMHTEHAHGRLSDCGARPAPGTNAATEADAVPPAQVSPDLLRHHNQQPEHHTPEHLPGTGGIRGEQRKRQRDRYKSATRTTADSSKAFLFIALRMNCYLRSFPRLSFHHNPKFLISMHQ
jgi:hypothetical protein